MILIMSIIMVDRFDHISPGLSSNAAVEHSVGQYSGFQQLQNAAAVAADTVAAAAAVAAVAAVAALAAVADVADVAAVFFFLSHLYL